MKDYNEQPPINPHYLYPPRITISLLPILVSSVLSLVSVSRLSLQKHIVAHRYWSETESGYSRMSHLPPTTQPTRNRIQPLTQLITVGNRFLGHPDEPEGKGCPDCTVHADWDRPKGVHLIRSVISPKIPISQPKPQKCSE